MTREEAVRNLLTELIDMIDNGSQRDLDRADEIGTSIIKLLEQEPIIDKIRAEIEECKQYRGMTGNPVIDKHNVGLDKYYDLGLEKAIKIIDKYKAESEE